VTSHHRHHTAATPDDLSARELDVVRLVTNGFSNDEIARELYLGINTVKTYIRTSYRTIGATRRVQAVLWGVQHGLLEGYAVVPAEPGQHTSRAS
jgi:DNA-binding NarL/FixJ family response regulator